MAAPFAARAAAPARADRSPAMGPVMAEITIDAPRERVFAMVADLAMRPAFCDHFLDEFRLQRIESTGDRGRRALPRRRAATSRSGWRP